MEYVFLEPQQRAEGLEYVFLEPLAEGTTNLMTGINGVGKRCLA